MRGKPKAGSKHPGGRPRKGVNQLSSYKWPTAATPNQVFALARCSLSGEEIASILGFSRDLLYKNPEFSTAFQKGHNECNSSLRRKQYEMAMRGDRTMLIWLGKQRLGQKERHEYSGPEGGPIPLSVDGVKDAMKSLIEKWKGREKSK